MPSSGCEDRVSLKGLDRSQSEGGVAIPFAQDCWTMRLTERHITAYPSCINYEALPPHARFPSGMGAATKANKSTCTPNKNDLSVPPSIMRTTNQIAGDLVTMGLAMGLKTSKNKIHKEKLGTDGSQNSTKARVPIGFRIGLLAPPYDARSTYRHDYSGEANGIGLEKDVWGNWLENYRKRWTAEDASDVDRAMQIPYLTVPDRICKFKPTMYRSDYMPRISRNDVRTLPHQINLPGIRSTYAYSAYVSDDPRRNVSFDPDVAAITELRSALYETYTPHSSYAEKNAEKRSLRDYLGQLRESMQSTHQAHALPRHGKLTPESESVPKLTRTVVIRGTNGCPSQCIPLDPENYIALPRDHFGHRPVYDY